jgi:hypothetical protein
MRIPTLIVTLCLIPAATLAAPEPKPSHTLNWVSTGTGPHADVRVNLDIENASVKEALQQILDQAKLEYVVDADVPETTRITARARNVKLYTALDLIAQAAGVNWAREVRDSRVVYRFGKTVSPNRELRFIATPRSVTRVAPNRLLSFNDYVPYSLFGREESSTFTCPHCSGKATVVGPRQQPKCPKCERTFQADWQFCPIDGTPRPTAPGAWQYCPLCGKRVETQRPATQRR